MLFCFINAKSQVGHLTQHATHQEYKWLKNILFF